MSILITTTASYSCPQVCGGLHVRVRAPQAGGQGDGGHALAAVQKVSGEAICACNKAGALGLQPQCSRRAHHLPFAEPPLPLCSWEHTSSASSSTGKLGRSPTASHLPSRSRCSTGERNGFTVLTEAEFYDFHLTTPDLTVMLMRVRASWSWHSMPVHVCCWPSPFAAGLMHSRALSAAANNASWAATAAAAAASAVLQTASVSTLPSAGQGRRAHHHFLHRRAGGRHTHAHVVRTAALCSARHCSTTVAAVDIS